MKIVSSYNEWDPLEEVIVGIPDFWNVLKMFNIIASIFLYSKGSHNDWLMDWFIYENKL